MSHADSARVLVPMLRSISLALVVVLSLVACDAVLGAAADGCTRDSDCKGDRVCTSGQCTEPVPDEAARDAPVARNEADAARDEADVDAARDEAPAARDEADAAPAKATTPAPSPVAARPEPAVAHAAPDRSGALERDPIATAEPSDAAPVEAPPREPSSAKKYAATIRGVCEKLVDCGCNETIESCLKPFQGIKVAKAALQCSIALDCAGICGTGGAECVKKVAAAEAAMQKKGKRPADRVDDMIGAIA